MKKVQAISASKLTKHGFIIDAFQSNAFFGRLDEKVSYKFIVYINFSCGERKGKRNQT